VIGREPNPEFAVQVADTCRHLLAALDNDTLREVAQAKMEGCTNEEVAQNLHCSLRTVVRRLRMIRSIWEKEDNP
jgi:DNA-directed RNA polymerase specialized sigma24 family protein